MVFYNHQLGLAINYKNIGNSNKLVKFLCAFSKNYHLSLNYNNKINSKIGKIICAYNIANVLIKDKKYTQALTTVDTILQLAIKEKDKYEISNTYNTLGLAQLNLNKLQAAKKNLETALNIATKFQH